MKEKNLPPKGISTQKAWAVLQKKDGYEYKKGDFVEISLSRRILTMRYNKKFQKIIPIIVRTF